MKRRSFFKRISLAALVPNLPIPAFLEQRPKTLDPEAEWEMFFTFDSRGLMFVSGEMPKENGSYVYFSPKYERGVRVAIPDPKLEKGKMGAFLPPTEPVYKRRFFFS